MGDEGCEERELNAEKMRELTNFRSGIRTFDFKRTYGCRSWWMEGCVERELNAEKRES